MKKVQPDLVCLINNIRTATYEPTAKLLFISMKTKIEKLYEAIILSHANNEVRQKCGERIGSKLLNSKCAVFKRIFSLFLSFIGSVFILIGFCLLCHSSNNSLSHFDYLMVRWQPVDYYLTHHIFLCVAFICAQFIEFEMWEWIAKLRKIRHSLEHKSFISRLWRT